MTTRRDMAMKPSFTLLELLVAVSIFAIVLAAINTVFYSALKLRNKSSEVIEKNAPLEQALVIIKRDLSNIVPPGGPLSGQLQSTPTSTTNTIAGVVGPTFYCSTGTLNDLTPFGDIQKVSYTLVQGTNPSKGMDLVRVVSRDLLAPIPQDPFGQLLISGVQQIGFFYYDPAQAQWIDSWDSTTQDPTLPSGIKMQILMAPDEQAKTTVQPAPIEIVVPLLVQGKTNATQTTQG